MPLVFLPHRHEFVLWGRERTVPELSSLASLGEPAVTALVTPEKTGPVDGVGLPLLETMALLAMVPVSSIPALPGSAATWALASKLALDLVSRERAVPTVTRRNGAMQAGWCAALSDPEDASQVAALARSMPPSAHAVPASGGGDGEVWAPEALLRAFLDAAVDTLIRAACGATERPATRPRPGRKRRDGDYTPWEQRWRLALEGSNSTFAFDGFVERSLPDDLRRWSEPVTGSRDRLRACFRLELPEVDGELFTLRFLLQSPDDPSLLVAAAEVWGTRGRSLARLGHAFLDPQESLLEALGRAARLFTPIAETLREARPEALALDPESAWAFLSEGAPVLAEAGFGVIVPGELTAAGQRRLRLRLRVGSTTRVPGAVAGAAGLGLDELLSFEWEASLGDTTLSARELQALANQKAPIVRYRGQWVVVDPGELAEIHSRMAGGAGKMAVRQALAGALSGVTRHNGRYDAVAAAGAFAEIVERMREAATVPVQTPDSFQGELRPYQARGLAWLATMGSLGLGACLADDMGLGKTIQLLAFLLHR
ncbi:MAG: ATP-dependent helicase, partial [Chloroflexi bacterium]|nr:ATP-dependent helicase [Chloroflexota bacterium]